MIADGKPWTDPDFPPEKKSLYDPRIDKSADRKAFDSYSWKRIKDIYGGKEQMFAGGIGPNDINQGGLGDCYFLAVLSSLAEVPERIADMFVTKDLNAAGIYMVKFYINGIQHPVIVDDHLPCSGRSGKPAFATSQDAELWVSILEKAWAKLHGSYARTEGGLPCFAANHLVGVPSESFSH